MIWIVTCLDVCGHGQLCRICARSTVPTQEAWLHKLQGSTRQHEVYHTSIGQDAIGPCRVKHPNKEEIESFDAIPYTTTTIVQVLPGQGYWRLRETGGGVAKRRGT